MPSRIERLSGRRHWKKGNFKPDLKKRERERVKNSLVNIFI